MIITLENIITAGAALGAVSAMSAIIFAIYRRYLNQNRQVEEIKNIKDEQTLMFYALLACLDGLGQLGANHSVTETKSRLEEHLNVNAHK